MKQHSFNESGFILTREMLFVNSLCIMVTSAQML